MLKQLLATLLRRLVSRLEGPTEPKDDLRQGDEYLDGGELSESRRRAALSVTEQDVEGFLLLVMSPDSEGDNSKITIQVAVPSHAWPAFIESMARVETFMQEHGRSFGH